MGVSVDLIVVGAVVAFIVIIALVAVFGTFFTVEQQRIKMVERFGKFVRIAGAGLNIKWPLVEHVAGSVNLRVQQLDVKVETKTEDNVFVHCTVAVQYFVHPEKAYEAYYKLQNSNEQITAFVFDVVRARVPKMKLDDVFEKKDEIADAVKSELTQMMSDFGYGIVKALVTDIEPDAEVKKAMNEINAAQRLRVAANEKGEAEKILRIKQAEAESESKKLQGQGIANQRKAIIEGLRESVESFKAGVEGSTSQDVMQLVLMTQYFDTLKEMGAQSKNTTVLIPHSPGTLADLSAQIRNALVTADHMNGDKG